MRGDKQSVKPRTGNWTSIRTAINKLRQALGDSGDSPKYVETVNRRGYRLMVAVEVVPSDSSGSLPILSPKAGERVRHPATWRSRRHRVQRI
jgi:DNA-binding winged helix-turn-helix (wHTH) protein